MKVVAINGSPKRKGNTNQAINIVLDELKSEGIDTEILHVGKLTLSGCTACGSCRKSLDDRCIIDDGLNEYIQKMKDADGIIIGSPVHFAGLSGVLKTFLDRVFYVSSSNGNIFRYKVGSAVVAVRRSGGVATFNQIMNYLLYSEMFIPTSRYWNVIHGRLPGEIIQDEEGVQIMRVLGRNMAYLLKMAELSKDKIDKPITEAKVMTSFVR